MRARHGATPVIMDMGSCLLLEVSELRPFCKLGLAQFLQIRQSGRHDDSRGYGIHVRPCDQWHKCKG